MVGPYHALALDETACYGWKGGESPPDAPMPTTFRLLLTIGAIVATGYGVLFLLANVLEPPPRDITVTVPPSRHAK
jgi:hypothetical protein